jgi:rhodanese-related sulfurtransferase
MSSGQQRPTSDTMASQHEAIHALHPQRPKSPDEDRGRGALERLVNRAVDQITRFSAAEAFAASAVDGVIIDIRSQDVRELQGVIQGSLHIPRTVLEWRVAIDSPWRNVHLGGLDQRLILICDHGYSSILAASNLVGLGFYRAGDVIGGFESWKDNGLPIAPCRPQLSTVGALPGTNPPE